MNVRLLVIILILHMLSDFYFQSTDIAERKEKEFKGVLYHGLLYFIPFGLYFVIGKLSLTLVLLFTILCIVHFLIDSLKYLYQTKIRRIFKDDSLFSKEGFIYLTDQGFHIITMVILCILLHEAELETWPWVGQIFKLIPVEGNLLSRWILLLLLIYKPMNITHGKLFSLYKPAGMEEASDSTAERDTESNDLHIAAINTQKNSARKGSNNKKKRIDKRIEREKKAGALIGFMERLIIVIFLYLQQYAAIGLVLTAKSIVRYDRISKEQEFSEYYLIGTLFSFISALVSYYAII